MKNINQILKTNPALAKELAKLLKEDLDQVAEVQETELTLPEVPAGENDNEVVPEAPETVEDLDNADVYDDGHSVDLELTAEDPVSEEEIDQMIEELPVEELEGEVEDLEEVVKDDEEQIEELDEVIEEATKLKEALKKRIVFTEGVINKVNARILTEAAKILSGKKALQENKKK